MKYIFIFNAMSIYIATLLEAKLQQLLNVKCSFEQALSCLL